MFTTKLFKEFFASERSGGLILVFVTVVSLILANSGVPIDFHAKFLGLSIDHWVNDGLMAVFFLMIGLELEREIYEGELSSWSNAALPFYAAIGGMIVPAAIHIAFNFGTPSQAGAGIPMATDIAFSLGILSLFKIPYALKVFLTALAIADDLGAILVIAFFYTKELNLAYLGGALAVFSFLLVLNRFRIQNLILYLIGGAFMWWLFLNSGIHATIAGVLLAFAIPFSKNVHDCVSHKLQHRLHFPVALVILPIFAFVNTHLPIDASLTLVDRNSAGIFLGLVVGKPLGILGFCAMAIALKLATPLGLSWRHSLGAGMLAGIGFTMSIFVSLLAFEHENNSQLAVLIASATSAVLGIVWFTWFVPVTHDSAQ